MTRLYLIRHGRPASTWGADDADADPGLDDQGHAQALAAAEALMALPESVRPQRVVSSPMRRCQETAKPFAERIGAAVVIDPRFGEIPTPTGLSATERAPWLRGAMAGRWRDIEGDIDYEAWRLAMGAAAMESGGCAVFSHFVAVNAALSCALGDERTVSFHPDHASITVFDSDGSQLFLIERGAEASTQIL